MTRIPPNMHADASPESLPFPSKNNGARPHDLSMLPSSAQDVVDVLSTMSRRIDDLARELHCLGYFDDDDDEPRAA